MKDWEASEAACACKEPRPARRQTGRQVVAEWHAEWLSAVMGVGRPGNGWGPQGRRASPRVSATEPVLQGVDELTAGQVGEERVRPGLPGHFRNCHEDLMGKWAG